MVIILLVRNISTSLYPILVAKCSVCVYEQQTTSVPLDHSFTRSPLKTHTRFRVYGTYIQRCIPQLGRHLAHQTLQLRCQINRTPVSVFTCRRPDRLISSHITAETSHLPWSPFASSTVLGTVSVGNKIISHDTDTLYSLDRFMCFLSKTSGAELMPNDIHL